MDDHSANSYTRRQWCQPFTQMLFDSIRYRWIMQPRPELSWMTLPANRSVAIPDICLRSILTSLYFRHFEEFLFSITETTFRAKRRWWLICAVGGEAEMSVSAERQTPCHADLSAAIDRSERGISFALFFWLIRISAENILSRAQIID